MTIVRIRRSHAGQDDYGDPIPGEETALELHGAFVAPRTSDAVDRDGRSGVVVGLTLYAAFGSDITYTDQVDVDGVRYEIEGEPGSWQHPMTGWRPGLVVALKRGEG